MAPRARFELATLRLTVAALTFATEDDDLLWSWFSMVVRAVSPQPDHYRLLWFVM